MEYVCFHSNCLDGFASAWGAWKKLKDSAEYLPWTHADPMPDEVKDATYMDTVYFVDICPNPNQLATLEANVVVLDHHVSAMQKFEEVGLISENFIFDMDHSGAYLSWNYFHPDKPIPQLVHYVQNMDLWKWELPHDHDVSRVMGGWEKTFPEFDRLHNLMENNLESLIQQGKHINEYVSSLVDSALQHSWVEEWNDLKIAICNTTIEPSNIGNQLLTYWEERGVKVDFSATFRHSPDSDGALVYKWSLRSGEGYSNVSEIAVANGGGGHPAASGCVTKEYRLKIPYGVSLIVPL